MVGYLAGTLPARKLRRELAAARYHATHDALTGLHNRAAAYHALMLAIRSHGPTSVAIADVDGLKEINDRNGHGVGDLVLRHVARQLSSALSTGTAARLETEATAAWAGS